MSMLIHFEIFSCILTLVLGSWIIYNVMQAKRTYAYSFLKPILVFICFYNVSVCFRLISRYTCYNILASCFDWTAMIYSRLMSPIAFVINVGMTVAIIYTVAAFLDKRVPRKVLPWVIGISGLLLISYGLRVFSDEVFAWIWLKFAHRILHVGISLVAYGFLAYLLFAVRRIQDREKRRMIRSFGLFYMTVYTLLILSFPLNPFVGYFLVILVHLLFNLFVIFWLRGYFLPYHRGSVSALVDESALEGICEKHRVSKREREIAELILKGMSNKEIEGALYISPHTVKNHIYSLYQKLGVNSRGQLIHLILESNS